MSEKTCLFRIAYRLRIEFWWFLECQSGRLWHTLAGDRVTYWLDWLPAFCLQQRAEAQGWRQPWWHSPNWARQRSRLYCWLMNLIDFRFWRCECHYQAPYGRVVMAGCPYHD